MTNYPNPTDLPAQPGLPDPLTFFDGTPVKTAAEWTDRRRPELRRLFQQYMYGEWPPTPAAVTSTVLYENPDAFGGKATLREVAVDIGAPAAGPVSVLLALPHGRDTAAPAFLGIAFGPNHLAVEDPGIRDPNEGRPAPAEETARRRRGGQKEVWNVERSIDRGYAVALFCHGDVAPDRPDWPTTAGPAPYGSIVLWAWGASRVLDYLGTEPAVDARRVAVVGHSRNGKAAIVAAAFDERFAMAIPSQSGCGGAAPSRTESGERVRNINGAFPHWFNDRFKQFNEAPERLPFDQHCLIGLMAPRPVLLGNAAEDGWANPPGQLAMLRAAEPVYRLLGADGAAPADVPDIGALAAGRLGYFVRAGGHSMIPEDWEAYLAYADRWL